MVGVLVFNGFASLSENTEVFCVPNNSFVVGFVVTEVSGTVDCPGIKPLNAATP